MKGKKNDSCNKLYRWNRAVVHHLVYALLAACIWNLSTAEKVMASPAQVQDYQTEQNTAEIATAVGANTQQELTNQNQENQNDTTIETMAHNDYESFQMMFQTYNPESGPQTNNDGVSPTPMPSVFEDPSGLGVFMTPYAAGLANLNQVPNQISVFKDATGGGAFTGYNDNSLFAINPENIEVQSSANTPPTGNWISSTGTGLPSTKASVFKDWWGNSALLNEEGQSYFARLSPNSANNGINETSVFDTQNDNSAFLAISPDDWQTIINNSIPAANWIGEGRSVFTTNDPGFANSKYAMRQSVFLTNDTTNNNVGNSVFLDPQGNSYLDDLTANTMINFAPNNGVNGYEQTSTNLNQGVIPTGWSETYTPQGWLSITNNWGNMETSALAPGTNFTLAQITAYASGISWETGINSGGTAQYTLTPSYQALNAISKNEFATSQQTEDNYDNNWWNWTVFPSYTDPAGYVNRWAQAFYSQPQWNTTTGAWSMTPYLSTLGGIDVTSSAEDQKTTDAQNQVKSNLKITRTNMDTWTNNAQMGAVGTSINADVPYTNLYNFYSTSTQLGTITETTALAAFQALIPSIGVTPPGVTLGGTNETNPNTPSEQNIITTIFLSIFNGIEWLNENVEFIQVLGTLMFVLATVGKSIELIIWAINGGGYPLKLHWQHMQRQEAIQQGIKDRLEKDRSA